MSHTDPKTVHVLTDEQWDKMHEELGARVTYGVVTVPGLSRQLPSLTKLDSKGRKEYVSASAVESVLNEMRMELDKNNGGYNG